MVSHIRNLQKSGFWLLKVIVFGMSILKTLGYVGSADLGWRDTHNVQVPNI